MKKRLISVLLCLAVAMGCMPLAAFAAGQAEYSVSTVEELIAAVLAINANGGDAAITLEGDITLSRDKWSAAGGGTDSGLTFQNGNVTIYGNGHTITADCSSNRGIDIRGTASVSLGAADYEQSLTLQGGGGNVNLTIPLLHLAENAALFLYDGVTVKDSLSLGTPAGIQLSGSSTCTMYGGQITNCNNGASVAGGVMVDNNASFFLCGGVISDCSGVSGGAVQISRQGRMLFSGGVIERCAGNMGGGVSLQYAAPIGDGSGAVVPGFTMTGGIIRSCSATQYGGGVCLYATEAAAEITGGSITDCEAGVYGGGAACLWGTLVVDNAAVCNNTAGQAADDIINYSGTITLGGIPAEQTLSSTGKTIEGWFDDGGDGGDAAVGVEPELLVGLAVAVPDDGPGAGGGPAALGVEALVAVHLELLAGRERPLLVGAAVAVPDDRLGAVGGGAVRHVEATPGRGADQRLPGAAGARVADAAGDGA